MDTENGGYTGMTENGAGYTGYDPAPTESGGYTGRNDLPLEKTFIDNLGEGLLVAPIEVALTGGELLHAGVVALGHALFETAVELPNRQDPPTGFAE